MWRVGRVGGSGGELRVEWGGGGVGVVRGGMGLGGW